MAQRESLGPGLGIQPATDAVFFSFPHCLLPLFMCLFPNVNQFLQIDACRPPAPFSHVYALTSKILAFGTPAILTMCFVAIFIQLCCLYLEFPDKIQDAQLN